MRTGPAVPYLPGELIDAIISCLLPDHQSISLCSLICRAWLPWTRRHLFQRVWLRPRNLLPFLLLLQSPYCTFPIYVRSLFISLQFELPTSCRRMLLDIFKGRHSWLDYEDDRIGLLNLPFHKAKLLVANAIHRRNRMYAVNIVRLFPALEHLQIELWGFWYKVGEFDGLPLLSPTLKSLAIISAGSTPTSSLKWNNFMEWVHRWRIYNISMVYYVGWMTDVDLEGMQAFLKVQGNSIRHIHFRPTQC
jgi:hypothetical protein